MRIFCVTVDLQDHTDMQTSKKFTLEGLIQTKIRNRILLCFALLFTVLSGITYIDFQEFLGRLSANFRKVCAELEDFTISQALIDNDNAIIYKIGQINENSKNFQIAWDKNGKNSDEGMTYEFPMKIRYNYPLRQINGQSFGMFSVKTPLIGTNEILREFIIRFLMLVLFSLAIFVVLYPLSRKIPNELIIKPVLNLLEILKKNPQTDKNSVVTNIQIEEIHEIQNKLQAIILQAAKNSENLALANLSKQVSHDIRSPIAALKAVKDSASKNLSADQAKLLTASINRITDIANTILPRSNLSQSTSPLENHFLWSLIDQLVSEKRVQYKDRKDVVIDFSFEGSVVELNTACDHIEFMRALSNIIDNAVEAKRESMDVKVSVFLKKIENEILLTVSDNGKGIAKSATDQVFDEGFTSDKIGGSGLGLFQARTSIELWNGKIAVQSEEGRGTKIVIRLQVGKCPDWLIEKINVNDHEKIVLLDDEEYFHQVIKDKFGSREIPIRCFQKISDFKVYLREDKCHAPIYLIDHDLKQGQLGLDVIRELNLQDSAILLTGNYDDRDLQKRSIEYGVRILPKPLLQAIPLG